MMWGEVKPGTMILWSEHYSSCTWFVLSSVCYVYRKRPYVKVKIMELFRSGSTDLTREIDVHQDALVLTATAGVVIV